MKNFSFALVVSVLAAGLALRANAAPTSVCDRKVDGATDRRAFTAQLQAEIDAASAKGGGRVTVTKGVHPCGTIYLKSGVELHLEKGAVLSGSTKSEDYDDAIPLKELYRYAISTNETFRKAFVFAENAHDIAITGPGVIDGNGLKFFDRNSVQYGRFWAKPPVSRPRMIVFMNCRGIRLEETTFKDCPIWTMWLRHCEDIAVSKIRVEAEPKMINSDGIDFDDCRHVRVGDSYFRTGDDAIVLRAIKTGRENGKRTVTEDVVVSNCYLYSACNAIRIGCPSDDTVRNAVFRDLVLEGWNGITSEMPTWYLNKGCNGSFVSANILFERCRIKTEQHPILLIVGKGVAPTDFGHMTFRDISFEGKNPILVWGNEKSPIRDIAFEKVRGKTDFPCPIRSNYVEGLRLDDVSVSADEK